MVICSVNGSVPIHPCLGPLPPSSARHTSIIVRPFPWPQIVCLPHNILWCQASSRFNDCITISLYSIALYFLGPYLPSFSNRWLNASWPSRWLVPINIVLDPHLMCNLTTNKTRLTHSLPQVVLQRAPMLFSIFITFELLVTCDLIL